MAGAAADAFGDVATKARVRPAESARLNLAALTGAQDKSHHRYADTLQTQLAPQQPN